VSATSGSRWSRSLPAACPDGINSKEPGEPTWAPGRSPAGIIPEQREPICVTFQEGAGRYHHGSRSGIGPQATLPCATVPGASCLPPQITGWIDVDAPVAGNQTILASVVVSCDNPVDASNLDETLSEGSAIVAVDSDPEVGSAGALTAVNAHSCQPGAEYDNFGYATIDSRRATPRPEGPSTTCEATFPSPVPAPRREPRSSPAQHPRHLRQPRQPRQPSRTSFARI
jgi:hypothetical protein